MNFYNSAMIFGTLEFCNLFQYHDRNSNGSATFSFRHPPRILCVKSARNPRKKSQFQGQEFSFLSTISKFKIKYKAFNPFEFFRNTLTAFCLVRENATPQNIPLHPLPDLVQGLDQERNLLLKTLQLKQHIQVKWSKSICSKY